VGTDTADDPDMLTQCFGDSKTEDTEVVQNPPRMTPRTEGECTWAVIDFQALRAPEYVIKELCIVDISNLTKYYWMFKTPEDLPLNEESEWLINCFHGITVDAGDVEFDELQPILESTTKNFEVLFSKGADRCVHLSKFLPMRKIHDLDDRGCPSVKRLDESEITCKYHSAKNTEGYVCSLSRALNMAKWCQKNKSMIEKSLNMKKPLTIEL